MRMVIATMAVLAASLLLSSALHANFTMFDLAKNSMYIARGEFTTLERTPVGDRMTLRCDEIIKGDIAVGAEVTLEAFEPAAADEGLGREVIVCFNLVNGKHYFLNHPFATRSFIFETDDVATNGLDQNEQSLRNFLAINAPYKELIESELRKRIELQQLGYQGEFDAVLINKWRDELLKQVTWAGTRSARDAAKAMVEHTLFSGTLNVSQMRLVSDHLAASAVGSIERAYMLELVRSYPETHPGMSVQLAMLREETSQACVGKLANLMLLLPDREGVLTAVGAIATDTAGAVQTRLNALQMFEAMKDANGLPYVHEALLTELENSDMNKDILRRCFTAMRSTPDAASVPVLDTCIAHAVVAESWELTQHAWIAYSLVDNIETNGKVNQRFAQETNPARKKFFQRLLHENKVQRKLIIVHPED
ncbi:MAG: hypothetical protein K8I27_14040 [Planctomycetes bacterium]|nr:hypothetical protein [Planctomycetota bacterium]